jgi:hypothetical protein
MTVVTIRDGQTAAVEDRVAEYLIDELTMGLGPRGVEMLSAEEYDGDDDDRLLVRFNGQRYDIEIEVHARPVPDPVTPEQEADQRARELQEAIESTMVPLFDTAGGAR